MIEIQEGLQSTNKVINLDDYRQNGRSGQEQSTAAQIPEHAQKPDAAGQPAAGRKAADAQSNLIDFKAFETARQEKLEVTRTKLSEQNRGSDNVPSTPEETAAQQEHAIKRMQQWGFTEEQTALGLAHPFMEYDIKRQKELQARHEMYERLAEEERKRGTPQANQRNAKYKQVSWLAAIHSPHDWQPPTQTVVQRQPSPISKFIGFFRRHR